MTFITAHTAAISGLAHLACQCRPGTCRMGDWAYCNLRHSEHPQSSSQIAACDEYEKSGDEGFEGNEGCPAPAVYSGGLYTTTTEGAGHENNLPRGAIVRCAAGFAVQTGKTNHWKLRRNVSSIDMHRISGDLNGSDSIGAGGDAGIGNALGVSACGTYPVRDGAISNFGRWLSFSAARIPVSNASIRSSWVGSGFVVLRISSLLSSGELSDQILNRQPFVGRSHLHQQVNGWFFAPPLRGKLPEVAGGNVQRFAQVVALFGVKQWVQVAEFHVVILADR